MARTTGLQLLSVLCLSGALLSLARCQASAALPESAPVSKPELPAGTADLLKQAPALQRHFVGLSPTDDESRLAKSRHHTELLREKLDGQWFAALVHRDGPEALGIERRFGTWKQLMDFLVEKKALVEVWAYVAGDARQGRRLTALEVSALKKQTPEQPTFITVTYREAEEAPIQYQVEFAFGAAEVALKASQAYKQHRELQLAGRQILSARDEDGRLNANAQWEALQKAVQAGRFAIAEMPELPTRASDLFTAFEYEVDDLGNYLRAVRVYRDSDLAHRVITAPDGQSGQIVLDLTQPRSAQKSEAMPFQVKGVSGDLLPAWGPILGQDTVELRVKNPNVSDPRRWNVLEFGEPEVLKQSALAKFSLISAYLEKRRKAIAWEKSTYDLIAEPIIAGLNIGGGIAGVPFPLGAAARLGYNVLVSHWMIPPVPSVKQMRELFLLMAAKERVPDLKTKPGEFLDNNDMQKLIEASQSLSEGEVVEFLQRVSDDDLKGMVRLAKMQRIDALVVNLLAIMADAGRVSGWTDEAGFQRDVFNSIYFSVTGEVSIKNIIAVLCGGEIATPHSGVSLYDLARGHGPAEAWLQYLNFTVDIRAVVNQVARVAQPSLAGKELRKPFPYAPRMTDFAAYEIRIFGFPLLIFYKRGLLKDDIRSFENDYAYGLIGATIVEHFPNRSDMDAEIRAGRMVPLGYVRVLGADGKFKETNLAVFAHRIPQGKHAGRTAVIIYGLKAYIEQSQLIQRELERFRQYDRALQEGGVIERVVDAQDRNALPPTALEPLLHVGPDAADRFYSPLLGGLLEVRRYLQRKTWGLPLETPELLQVADILEDFGRKGIWLDDGDSLLEVDPFNSTFIYRRYVQDKWRHVQLTHIPTLHDLDRDLAKAGESQRLEARRRAALSENGRRIALIHRAQEVGGRLEIGPLVLVEDNPEAIAGLLDLIERLPVTDRARLKYNQFAGTLLELDLTGTGKKERFFITLEFPIAGQILEERSNPLSGEHELLAYPNGLWTTAVTDTRLLEIDYDNNGEEVGSRLFANLGSRNQPRKGALLEETRTLEVWHRNLNQPNLDPYLPMIAKLKVSHVTGQTTREIYGLFPLPISVVDEQFITANQFNEYGVFAAAQVFNNGRAPADFQRPLLSKLTEPIIGERRFQLTSALPATELAALRELRGHSYKTVVRQQDLLKGQTRMVTFDNAHFGRRLMETWVDELGGNNRVAQTNLFEYQDNWFYGLIPVKSRLLAGPNSAVAAQVENKSYDPATRRLVGVEVDYTGKVVTNTWDYRWESPIEVESLLRKTVNQYNWNGTEVTSRTTAKPSGEEIIVASARFDAAAHQWIMDRTIWHQPGVTSRSETVTLSGSGKTLFVRTANLFEARPSYNANGFVQSVRTFRRDAASGHFDILHQQEDEFHWNGGQCDARVQVYVDGQLYDQFRRLRDAEGRTILDGLKQFDGLELKTVTAYDGGSERALTAETLQNGRVRLTRQNQAAVRQADGTYVLPVKATPAWGLSYTETFRLGDPLARPVSKVVEDGQSVRVTDWFDGMSLARTSELRDRFGRPKERFSVRLNAGTDGKLPFDLLRRESLSYWGTAALTEERALLRGTDLPLFKTAADERIYYNLAEPYDLPAYAVDPQGKLGISVVLAGRKTSHVLSVFSGRPAQSEERTGPRTTNEPTLTLRSVDLQGLLFHKVSVRTLDRAGNLLEEGVAKITHLSEPEYRDEILVQKASRVTPTKRFHYRYDRGWLVERPDPATGGRMLSFSENPPAAGGAAEAINSDGHRDFATEIEGSKPALEEAQGAGLQSYSYRRLHTPAQRERNPFQPGVSNIWTSWIATELKPNREKLFDSELIYDSQGRLAVAKASKLTSQGRPGSRIAYTVPRPPPEAWRQIVSAGPTNGIPLEGITKDLSRSDFLYFYFENTNHLTWNVAFQAAAGRPVYLRRGHPNYARSEVAPWPVGDQSTRWLPDRVTPQHGVMVTAPDSLLQEDHVVAVAIADLARAGLDIRQLVSATLHVSAPAGARLQLSPVYYLGAGSPFIADKEEDDFEFEVIPHSNGLVTLTQSKTDRTAAEVLGGLGQEAAVKLNGLPVATVRLRTQIPAFPMVVFTDNSDPDAPRPLYALSLHEGRFLEHYRMPRWGDAQIYTIVNGFDVPRYDVYRARTLDDEVSPSFTAYGYDYAVSMETAKGRGLLAESLATIRNRVAANGFRLAGQQTIQKLTPTGFVPISYGKLHHARQQAQEINQLPTLAQALTFQGTLPWSNGPVAAPEPPLNKKRLGVQLLELHVRKFLMEPASSRSSNGELALPTGQERRTGLIPTSIYPTARLGSARPDDDPERFVDTAREAELIELAIGLEEFGLARALLDFYWHRSVGGTKLLHASYDAETQASKVADPLFKRPPYARQTADAQLGIARAALLLGTKTEDTNALALAANLVGLVLDKFRPSKDPVSGIAEFEVSRKLEPYGVHLWPERQVFSLRSNAEAYLLLKRLHDLSETNTFVGRFLASGGWSQSLNLALTNQATWLRSNILAHVEQTGIVPKGLFEIQDVHEATTATAVERWTSAEDWLWFLEAAHALEVPATQTRVWLENLARVHGVTVQGIWGLDWSIPLVRADAVSPELTAKFARVARLLGHQQAAAFAQQSVRQLMRTNQTWPEVVTAANRAQPLPTGQGFYLFPDMARSGWARTLGVEKELIRPTWEPTRFAQQRTQLRPEPPSRADMVVFVTITALFYLAILLSTIFWWRFRRLRHAEKPEAMIGQLVPDPVMHRAEERWAKRVLGAQTPATAEKARFSNATVEQNFLMQLRAIYKLVVEWRRQENGWAEDDARIAEDDTDDWLNGLDEFASFIGLYMRWVVKAGTKDGFEQQDFLKENEDSNHIWSRLVMYFAEYYWAMLTLVSGYPSGGTYDDKAEHYGKFSKLLTTMGVRQRDRGFDARVLFNYPANPLALDLLVIQRPGATLEKVLLEISMKLKIPYSHAVDVIGKYKQFRRREQPFPIHPYIVEFAKVLPHFVLMSLGALVLYNQTSGESPIVPYLWSVLVEFTWDQTPQTLLWALPLFGSLVFTVLSHIARIYRFSASILPRGRPEIIWDKRVTSLFVKTHDVLPGIKPGRRWKPEGYQRIAWALRAVGYLGLGWALLQHPAPSFATFLVLKGILAMLAFTEVLAVVLPLTLTYVSNKLQDHVTSRPRVSRLTRFLSQLNLTATRPASPLWLAFKYHTQPSVPSGSLWGLTQAMVFYFLLGGVFFAVGVFLCQEMFPLWFTDKYLSAADGRLFVGSLVFWNTMYLLRYGLFLLFTGVASALASFPIKSTFGMLGIVQLLLVLTGQVLGMRLALPAEYAWPAAAIGLVAMFFERELLALGRRALAFTKDSEASRQQLKQKLAQVIAEKRGTLGVVYMSGDDLSFLKLTPALLMTRWRILRDKLDSDGLDLVFRMANRPSDSELEAGFKALYEAEKAADVTLWHPSQLSIPGEASRFAPELGLRIPLQSEEERQQLLRAWHVRRWLVTMMSTAGHSQDTAINLVDVALRLEREGLAPQTAFYLIQNKYDNNDNNRPVQTPYDKGELGQRNKLARLICAVAPGARAYCVQNWTPFGFKAGGLTGMDLIYEETLDLTTMLVLDRNANVHDLDALMEDLAHALTDPDLVIIIPGRSTTNTQTPLGQGSQMVEEGHRSFLKGLMAWLGGTASESVGTGWGNLLAVLYGRVQRAMVNPGTPKMPLTSRMERGSSFAVRTEGLIGFTPHAVGISEDTWAVSQAMHNAVALGHRVKFQLSKAIWHKIRETWSHSEWLASFPRWSGGFLQMMHDPIMQKINDFGPVSVFAKEVRANSGRNFLTAPFALLNIVLMPLAILLDVTPFVQILVILWNFGFIMNQILTVHGLNTYLESSGFYRLPAGLGAAAGTMAGLLVPTLRPYAPGLAVVGLLMGGFFTGWSRWLYNRIRDMILFGPQLVLHALGQLVRQSLEFTVSGASPEDAKGVNMAFRSWAGPREDRPHDLFANLINLKTIVWVVGLLSVVLNIFALSNLDMLNVLLLLPSLLFSVSTLIGPFLMTPKAGTRLGKWIAIPKALGWLSSVAFYVVVSLLIGETPRWRILGAGLFCILFGLLLSRVLRYARFHSRLRAFRAKVAALLTATGSEPGPGDKLAAQVMQNASDPAKVQNVLGQAGLAVEHQVTIMKLVEAKIAPYLRSPVQVLERGRFAQSRFASAYVRSFALSLFVLLWFFIVPVPGLFVFTARHYRISVELSAILSALSWGVGLALVSYWTGMLIETWERSRSQTGLAARVQDTFRVFQTVLASPGRLSNEEVSNIYALFTDAQTYLDQRSYEYAHRSLEQIRRKLGAPRRH